MDAHQYLTFAESLARSVKDDPAQPNAQATCRSAISRAYYALFLLTREFVESLGIEARRVPSSHVTLEQALQNSGVLTLERIGEAIGALRSARTDADYDMRKTEVETLARVEYVLDAAKAAILQLDLIRAGRFSPPLDRDAVAATILKWASDNGKPLWRKS